MYGDKTAFYVWINEDGRGDSTTWIKGVTAFALWHKFARLVKKDKKGFIALAKEIAQTYPKTVN